MPYLVEKACFGCPHLATAGSGGLRRDGAGRSWGAKWPTDGRSGSSRIPCPAHVCLTEHRQSSAFCASEFNGAEDRLATHETVQARLLVAAGALGVALLCLVLAVDLTGANETAVPSLPTPPGLPSSLPSMPPLPSAPDFSGLPSGFPTNLPSGFPTHLPTGLPTDLLTDLPSLSGGGS